MILGCPGCSTKFGIPDGALGADGRKVKCAKCGHVWHAMAEDLEDSPAPQPSPATHAPAASSSMSEDASETVEPKDKEPEAQEVEEDQMGDVSEGTEEAENSDLDENNEDQGEEGDAEGDVEENVDDDEGSDNGLSADSTEEEKTEDEIVSEVNESIGSGSVEEALAAIRNSNFEEPEDPIEKGLITEHQFEPSGRGKMIGWASLGVFVVALVTTVFAASDTLSRVWPPITGLYHMVGISYEDAAHKTEVVDFSQYINMDSNGTQENLANGTPALVIRGTITNTAPFPIDLPPAKGVLRNDLRQDVHEWGFGFEDTTLGAGRTMPFITSVQEVPQGTTQYELFLLWGETGTAENER